MERMQTMRSGPGLRSGVSSEVWGLEVERGWGLHSRGRLGAQVSKADQERASAGSDRCQLSYGLGRGQSM